ncbi:Membrane protein involved in the export of O-antigen and teichoic acid [Kandleria vitulina]|uniref:oligosaccharide flippase family protein n=1 Tax=Kandleria vitulina TaxID=1630 RepID=UPI00087EAAB9|nr:oligosaccharide flippase family protein [Kandleria vitulina]SDL41507.1 Membrane protein involved in the export of O-antigen and teichoic acid [Kandleria vitulina]
MSNRLEIKSIFQVALSNILKLLSGVLVGFLLPKLIGVEDYGYYKTFTLYASYVGVFHFGLADGIYLKFGGLNYNELDRKHFRFYIRFFIFLEMIISLMLMIYSLFFLKNDYLFIFVCISIFLFFNNIIGYFQLISQITSRFKELAIRNIINSLLTVVSVLIILLISKIDSNIVSYKLYVIQYLLIFIVLAIWYIKTYSDIVFGEMILFKYGINDIVYFIKIGFPLMLSILCSSLVLTIDRQFVSILYDIRTYSLYAFAYNMLSLITTSISAISTVLYPTLKRMDKKNLQENYSNLNSIIIMLVYGCMITYFPLSVIVRQFLPQYLNSLYIFRIIFPGLVLSSSITIVMHNYYKTLSMNTEFFVKCVIVLILSTLANWIAYKFVGTPSSISIASIIVLFFWYISVEYSLISKYCVAWKKNMGYILLMMFSFYIITLINNIILSGFIYISIYILITFVIFHDKFKSIFIDNHS